MSVDTIAGKPIGDFNMACRRIVSDLAEGVHDDIVAAGRPGLATAVNDGLSQRRFAAVAKRWLPPGIGIEGRSRSLRTPSRLADRTTVTVDLLDGRQKLAELLQTGEKIPRCQVAVMLGVQVRGAAAAGYICDVASRTVYMRGPHSQRVVQIEDGAMTDLGHLERPKTLASAVVMRHGPRVSSNGTTQRVKDCFGRAVSGRGSIGMAVVRVFTGSLGGVVRPAGATLTPWVDTPIIAMCRQGDVVMLRAEADRLVELEPQGVASTIPLDYDVWYLHRKYVAQVAEKVRVVSRRR